MDPRDLFQVLLGVGGHGNVPLLKPSVTVDHVGIGRRPWLYEWLYGGGMLATARRETGGGQQAGQ